MDYRSKLTRRAAALGVAGALVAAMAGCGAAPGAVPPEGSQPAAAQAIEVKVASAAYGTIDRQTEFVGRVEAADSVKVYATSQAKVLKTYAAPGEYVEKGQLLFELDTENLQTMVETARLQYEAALSGANTTIIQSKNAYDSAGSMYSTLKESRDELEDARDGARSAAKRAQSALAAADSAGMGEISARYQGLLDQLETAEAAIKNAEDKGEDPSVYQEEVDRLNQEIAEAKGNDEDEVHREYTALQEAVEKAQSAVAQAENAYIQNYDKLDEQVDSARKSLVTARDTYQNTKGDEEAGVAGTIQSQVDLAKISYDNAVKSLNEAKVYAPVAGIVSARNVAASDMATPGAPAYIIDQEGGAPMVSFNLSEDGANALTVGSPVTVVYSGQEYPAHITELSNSANPQTGLYAAKAQTDEPLGTSRSGGVVKVKASTAKAENALLLPLELLEYDENQPFVYVYRDGTAVRVDVATGISSAEEVVILSGITAGDQIITTWHPDLKDGAAVALAQQQ